MLADFHNRQEYDLAVAAMDEGVVYQIANNFYVITSVKITQNGFTEDYKPLFAGEIHMGRCLDFGEGVAS